jgi:PAS domain S-box-containing protein
MTPGSVRDSTLSFIRTFNIQQYLGNALPLLILAFGFAATYFLQNTAVRYSHQKQQENFESRNREILLRIENRVATYQKVLLGVKGLFVASNRVDRNEFHSYIENLHPADNLPGFQLIGFSQFISQQEQSSHTKSVRQKDFPGKSMLVTGKRDFYTSILYQEPFQKHKQLALSHDMFLEGEYRAAMEQARDLDIPTISGKVTLEQEADSKIKHGFVMYVPVFRNGSPHNTLTERRSNIVGWIYATILIDDLMKDIFVEKIKEIDINIFDGEKITSEGLLYDTDLHIVSEQRTSSLFLAREPIRILGHNWIIEYRSMPFRKMQLDSDRVAVIEVAGISLSFLLSLLVFQLNRVSRRASINTQNLRIAATVFESREGMFITDANRVIVRVNSTFTQISGYSADEAVGKKPRMLSSGRHDAAFYAEMWKSINNTGAWQGEIWNRRKNGEVYPESLSITVVKDNGNRVTNYVAVFSDITERKNAEQMLHEKQIRINEAQQIALIGSWDIDLAKGRITWSDEMYRIFGASAETLRLNPENFIERIHPDDRASIYGWMDACISGGKPGVLKYRCIHTDGTIRYLEGNGRLFYDAMGKPDHMSGMTQNVTERRQIENRLRESEERLALATSSSGIGIWDWDVIHNKMVWDDSTFKMYGQDIGDFTGAYKAWQNSLHLDDVKRHEQACQDALIGIKPYDIEFRVHQADGSIRHINGRAQVFRDAQGKPLRMVGVNLDITRRKQMEEQLLNTLHNLEVNEKAKTRFLAAAGHDLRQPVTAASLFVHALKLTSPTRVQAELIESLSKSMTTFSDLLERLLDISKFDAGLIKPQIGEVSMLHVFNWLDNYFSLSAQNKSLSFRCCYPKNMPLIALTDRALLESVLMNLVSNAVKFTEHGGILISARPRGDKILLQVWDTGIGIAADNIPLIFDEFYQVANQHRSRDGGLGLGLSICQRASTLLGGNIKCRSRLGCGTVFELTLPLAAEQDIVESLPGFNEHIDDLVEILVRGKRIAVIEDDELVAAGLVSLLQGLGAEVVHFSNAEDALQLHDIGDADLFFVDYSLGGELTGIDFLEAIQRRQEKQIVAFVITGETSTEFMKSIANCNWPVLHKPINFRKLSIVLSAIADSYSTVS